MFKATMFWASFDMERRAKTFPACMQTYGTFRNRLSLTLLGDCPDIRNISDYEKNVGF